jgi:hypothetical protein
MSGRICYRMLQIYLGYLVTVVLGFALLLAFQNELSSVVASTMNLARLFESPADAIIAGATFGYAPYLLYVLGAYLLFLLATPLIVWSLERSVLATLSGSAALWFYTIVATEFGLPRFNADDGFDPLSWQFLFVIGLVVGRHAYANDRPLPRRTTFLHAAWAIVMFGFAAQIGVTIGHKTGAFDVGPLEWLLIAPPGAYLGVLRLAHILAIAYLVAWYVPKASPLLKLRLLRPLIVSGQRSLEVFCLGILFSLGGCIYLDRYAPGMVTVFFLNVSGWVLLAGFAMFIAWAQRAKPRREAAATARVERSAPRGMAWAGGTTEGRDRHLLAVPVKGNRF